MTTPEEAITQVCPHARPIVQEVSAVGNQREVAISQMVLKNPNIGKSIFSSVVFSGVMKFASILAITNPLLAPFVATGVSVLTATFLSMSVMQLYRFSKANNISLFEAAKSKEFYIGALGTGGSRMLVGMMLGVIPGGSIVGLAAQVLGGATLITGTDYLMRSSAERRIKGYEDTNTVIASAASEYASARRIVINELTRKDLVLDFSSKVKLDETSYAILSDKAKFMLLMNMMGGREMGLTGFEAMVKFLEKQGIRIGQIPHDTRPIDYVYGKLISQLIRDPSKSAEFMQRWIREVSLLGNSNLVELIQKARKLSPRMDALRAATSFAYGVQLANTLSATVTAGVAALAMATPVYGDHKKSELSSLLKNDKNQGGSGSIEVNAQILSNYYGIESDGKAFDGKVQLDGANVDVIGVDLDNDGLPDVAISRSDYTRIKQSDFENRNGTGTLIPLNRRGVDFVWDRMTRFFV